MENDAKVHQDKFSELEDDEVYLELEKFVHYLAGRNANPSNTMMEYDEIVGELMLEMVKGMRAYPHLEKDNLKAVIRRMMDNRVSELRYRFYATHRAAENKMISIDVEVNVSDAAQLDVLHPLVDYGETPVEELIEDIGSNPADIYESADRVRITRTLLSPVARQVFDAVVYGNNMLATLVWLSTQRASCVFKSSEVNVKPWHIADALRLDERVVKEAFKEIKTTYMEVCNG